MKRGRSKPNLNERLKQKVDQVADHQAELLATQLTSFSDDIEKRVQTAKHTIEADIDQLVHGMTRKLQAAQTHNEAWTQKTLRASEKIEQVRLDWIKSGVATILAPMLIGAMCSAVSGLLIASIYFWQTPTQIEPTASSTRTNIEIVTGLGGLGRVARHPPGSQVVPCPLRSQSESVCVKLPRGSQ